MFEYVVFGSIQFIRALITGPTCPNCRMQKCTDSTSCLGLGRWSPLLPGASLELLAWGSCWCCFRPYSFCFPWAFPFNNLSLFWIYIFFPLWRLLSRMSHLETPVSPEPRPHMETINSKNIFALTFLSNVFYFSYHIQIQFPFKIHFHFSFQCPCNLPLWIPFTIPVYCSS